MKSASRLAVLGFLFLTLAGVAIPAAAEPVQGSYWYVVDHITTVDPDGRILLWVALPPDRPEQTVTITAIEPEPAAILEDPVSGNRIIEWIAVPQQQYESTASFFHFDFELIERPVRFEFEPGEVKPYDTGSDDYRRYTSSEIWIQTDGPILDQARAIVGDESNPWLQARLIFAWVMQNLTFVPGGEGEWDAAGTLQGRRGNCSQFSNLFTALCRSIGIPARTVTNVWIDGGAHDSAEILLEGIGWVPMDTSLGQMLLPDGGGLTEAEVARFMRSKEIPLGDPFWLAGNLFSNRLITTVGNNLRVESGVLQQHVEFQQMNPGGADAHPQAIELRGLNRDIIHGGFFVFGEKVVDEDHAHALTHQRLAQKFFKEGLYDVVDDACRQSVKLYGDEIQNWINEGKMYMYKGEYYKAEAAFKRAQSGVASNREAKAEALVWTHNYLGNCYDLLGKRRLAKKEYEKVLEIGNNYRGAVEYAERYLKRSFDKKVPEER